MPCSGSGYKLVHSYFTLGLMILPQRAHNQNPRPKDDACYHIVVAHSFPERSQITILLQFQQGSVKGLIVNNAEVAPC